MKPLCAPAVPSWEPAVSPDGAEVGLQIEAITCVDDCKVHMSSWILPL